MHSNTYKNSKKSQIILRNVADIVFIRKMHCFKKGYIVSIYAILFRKKSVCSIKNEFPTICFV